MCSTRSSSVTSTVMHSLAAGARAGDSWRALDKLSESALDLICGRQPKRRSLRLSGVQRERRDRLASGRLLETYVQSSMHVRRTEVRQQVQRKFRDALGLSSGF